MNTKTPPYAAIFLLLVILVPVANAAPDGTTHQFDEWIIPAYYEVLPGGPDIQLDHRIYSTYDRAPTRIGDELVWNVSISAHGPGTNIAAFLYSIAIVDHSCTSVSTITSSFGTTAAATWATSVYEFRLDTTSKDALSHCDAVFSVTGTDTLLQFFAVHPIATFQEHQPVTATITEWGAYLMWGLLMIFFLMRQVIAPAVGSLLMLSVQIFEPALLPHGFGILLVTLLLWLELLASGRIDPLRRRSET